MRGFIAASILFGASFMWLDEHYNKLLESSITHNFLVSKAIIEAACRR